MTAPCGSPAPPPAPAFVSRLVTDAGMLATTQCHHPDADGASASRQVTTKLRVPDGNPDHDNCGDRSAPPANAAHCPRGSGSPCSKSAPVTLNEATGRAR